MKKLLLLNFIVLSFFAADNAQNLLIASKSGKNEDVHMLLAAGTDINQANKQGTTPLHSAAYHGHENTTELLLNNGALPNPVHIHGDTPLHTASLRGHINITKLLLIHGADKNIKNKIQKTACTIAQERGYGELAKFIKNSPDILPLRACVLNLIYQHKELREQLKTLPAGFSLYPEIE